MTNGQTVSEWVGEFTPVVPPRHAETAWPQAIVLDSREFKYTNVRTGTQRSCSPVARPRGATRPAMTRAAGDAEGLPDGRG